MQTLISGQAGLAIVIQGDTALVTDADADGAPEPFPLASVPLLLSDATDVVQYDSISAKDIAAELALSVSRDRALHLALIMLDSEEDVETRQMAAEDIEEGLQDPTVYGWVADRLSAPPLPSCVDLEAVREMTQQQGAVARFVDELEQLQPAVRRYWNAWRELAPTLFESQAERDECQRLLIHHGAFRGLAHALDDPTSFGMARYKCYQALAQIPGSREILDAWLRRFIPKNSQPVVAQEPDLASSPEAEQVSAGRGHMSDHEVFENVKRQKEAIAEAIRASDLRKVRKYTRQLVQFQLGHGGPEFAAKSLCDLAQEARRVRAHSLQLELVLRATEVAPTDAWACGQVADACCCLQRYEEALRWFDRAAALGDLAFAATGRARVLQEQGQLERALTELERACSRYPNEDRAWTGLAGVQRELLLLDEALGTYEAAWARFPQDPVPRCGRAAVLKQLGRLEEALSAYDEVIRDHPDCLVAMNGRAEVLREMGRFDDALAAYECVMETFPGDSVAYCGRGQVLKEMSRLDDALRAYEEATERFAYVPVPWNGRAEVYREMGRLPDALRSYDEAVRRFPGDVWTLDGRANILKELGRLEEALQAYDQVIRDFPHDLFARSGRAHLLKELGHLVDAQEAYARVMELAPHEQSARHARAAVLVALGRYAEAESILPSADPRTRDEWIAYHVRGVILLKRGHYEKAVAHFEAGLASIPFVSQRKYFRNALAVAAARARKLRHAASYLGTDRGPMTDVLRVHIFGALRNQEEARRAYERLAAICPPFLTALRDELAARYSLRDAEPQFDWAWVFEQECTGVLLVAA